mmetsp:Transcript_138478/g.195988  ORF Transcript_138478/g.195988 Transcript_138478/m.195988 type:complete len:262 (-) Transcript_138478:204-989(-)
MILRADVGETPEFEGAFLQECVVLSIHGADVRITRTSTRLTTFPLNGKALDGNNGTGVITNTVQTRKAEVGAISGVPFCACDGDTIILHFAGLAGSVVATAFVGRFQPLRQRHFTITITITGGVGGLIHGLIHCALYTDIVRAKLLWHGGTREACLLSALSRVILRNINPLYGDLRNRRGLKGISAVVCVTLEWKPARALILSVIEVGISAVRGIRSVGIHRKTRALVIGSAKVIHALSTTGKGLGTCFNRALCSHLHEGI